MTLNRNTVCQPHRDKFNFGDMAIMFLGEYEGGGTLLLEDGRRFEERGVWHKYDGARLLQRGYHGWWCEVLGYSPQ